MTGPSSNIFGQLLLEKLLQQHQEHGRLIVAFDFDDTVSPYRYPMEVLLPIHDLLKECYQAGHELVCFTANDNHEKVRAFLHEHEIQFHTINQSSVPSKGKIFYNIFLEDKTGLDQTLEILREFLRRTV